MGFVRRTDYICTAIFQCSSYLMPVASGPLQGNGAASPLSLPWFEELLPRRRPARDERHGVGIGEGEGPWEDSGKRECLSRRVWKREGRAQPLDAMSVMTFSKAHLISPRGGCF